jgi:hypothetical protein
MWYEAGLIGVRAFKYEATTPGGSDDLTQRQAIKRRELAEVIMRLDDQETEAISDAVMKDSTNNLPALLSAIKKLR